MSKRRVELEVVDREAGLIVGERRGTWVYYQPVPENLGRLAALLDASALANVEGLWPVRAHVR